MTFFCAMSVGHNAGGYLDEAFGDFANCVHGEGGSHEVISCV